MAPPQSLTAGIDEILARFNKRQMDLPDAFFDRRAQFLINDAPFEALLGKPSTDPLILMLTRGPAGYRFTAKGLQHAMPNARVERGAIDTGGDASTVTTKIRIAGTLHTTGEHVDAAVDVVLRLNSAGLVEVASATMDKVTLEKLREARRS